MVPEHYTMKVALVQAILHRLRCVRGPLLVPSLEANDGGSKLGFLHRKSPIELS